jgi:hypothetical protein
VPSGLTLLDLLLAVAAALGVLLVGMVLVMVLGGELLDRRNRRDEQWLEQVHAALLATDGSNPLRGGTRRRHALALATLGQHVTGPQRELLRTWATQVALDHWAHRSTWSARGDRRVAAISVLSTLGIRDDLRDRACGDRSARVRGCAAETDFLPASPARVDRLIGLTTDPSPRVRFAARDSLARLGGAVAPALLPYLDSADPSVAAAALDVAQTTPHLVLLPAALRLSGADRLSSERLAALRLLSLLDCPQRVTVLRAALDDADPQVRAAAADGLRRARAVVAAGPLADRLRDPAWEVRRAAGRALVSLGPVGQVLLRSAVRSDDRFAVDMARSMLHLPPVADAAAEPPLDLQAAS